MWSTSYHKKLTINETFYEIFIQCKSGRFQLNIKKWKKRKVLIFLAIFSCFCLLVSKFSFEWSIVYFNFINLKYKTKTVAYIDVEVRELRQILGVEIVDIKGLKIKKLNKTARGMVGSVIVLASDIDNTLIVEVKLSIKQGGEYRKLPYKLPPTNFCDCINKDVYAFPDLVKVSNIPSPLPCPVEPVQNFKLKLSKNENNFYQFSGKLHNQWLRSNA